MLNTWAAVLPARVTSPTSAGLRPADAAKPAMSPQVDPVGETGYGRHLVAATAAATRDGRRLATLPAGVGRRRVLDGTWRSSCITQPTRSLFSFVTPLAGSGASSRPV